MSQESSQPFIKKKQNKALIQKMYDEVFVSGDVDRVPEYFAANYQQETDYDVLDYNAFVAHVKDLSSGPSVSFKLDYLVITDTEVVVRSIVNASGKIAGAGPVALVISVWQINDDNKVSYCREVMST